MLREIVEKRMKFDEDDVVIVDSKHPKDAYFVTVNGVSEHGDYWVYDHEDYSEYEISQKDLEKSGVLVGNRHSFDAPLNSDIRNWVEMNLDKSERK